MLKSLERFTNLKFLRTVFRLRNLESRPISHLGNFAVEEHFPRNPDRTQPQHYFNHQIVRYYAKGKDKKKEKGKAKIEVNEIQLAEIINIDTLKNLMEKPINVLKDEYVKQLSVRSSSGSIETITVHFDGKDHTLQELAQVVRKNPKTIVINMSVFPQAIPDAIKAIQKSGMNLNPQQDGTTIYIPIPVVTKEHRENLAKNAKTLFIKCKDAIRDVQNKQFKSLKRKEGISQDLIKNIELQVTAIADSYINEAEQIMQAKQSELVGHN